MPRSVCEDRPGYLCLCGLGSRVSERDLGPQCLRSAFGGHSGFVRSASVWPGFLRFAGCG